MIAAATFLMSQSGFAKKPKVNDLVRKIQVLRPSVVAIWVNGQRAGTGFVVGPNGQILTATHVVAVTFPAYPIRYVSRIEVVFSDGQRLSATPVENTAEDAPFFDMTLLKTERTNTVPLKLSKQPMLPAGSEVYLMGFPLDLPEAVTYTGTVASEYDLEAGILKNQHISKRMIQVEAPIAKGFSGSALLDYETGEVIGVIEIKIGGINEQLEPVGKQIAQAGGTGGVFLSGVDTNKALLNLIAVLDQYLSAGSGSAVSVQHISDFVQAQVTGKK
jgi:S1-C subfamily serine protease